MKRKLALTPAQLKALDYQRNIAVTASAGSGKTATLVERYIALLSSATDIRIPQILAITFTQKAASEMRQRVGVRLQELLNEAATKDARLRLQNLYDDLIGARISTIHAFCATLLRQHPIEAQVDPHFAVLEEVDAAILRTEAVRETLEKAALQEDYEPLKKALRRLLQEWNRGYLENILLDLLHKKRQALAWCQRYRHMTAEQIFASWQEIVELRLEPLWQTLLDEGELLPLLADFVSLEPLHNAAKDTAAILSASVRIPIQTLLDNPVLENALQILPLLAETLTTAKGTPIKAKKGKKENWAADELARFRSSLQAIGALLAPHRREFTHRPRSIDTRAAVLLPALGLLLVEVSACYERKKGSGTRLDFDDLQERCLQLLTTEDGRIARQLARQYRYVMVDEFQDTDLLQWELIQPLVAPDGKLAPDKLFIVGDPKQSIYSFRDADVTVFEEVKQTIRAANREHRTCEIPFAEAEDSKLESCMEERLGTLVMGDNFRTLPVPVAFANMLFEQIIHPLAGEPWQVSYDPLISRRPHPTCQGSVELILALPGNDEQERDNILREADLIAMRIRQILSGDLSIADGDQERPATTADIAILLRRRRFLPLYEQALRSLQIPFQVVGGLGFYQRQEVYDLANILRFLDNSNDDVALLGALRSPYFGLSDNGIFFLSRCPGTRLATKLEEVQARLDSLPAPDQKAAISASQLLRRWRQFADRHTLAELLHTILEDTGAWGFLSFGERGEQTIANIEKILDLARTFEASGFSTLADFVAYINILISEEEKEGEAPLAENPRDVVQIMTIHASKGLEFPIVFVPDLDAPFNLKSGSAGLLDPNLGIGLSVQDPEAAYHRKATFLRELINEDFSRKTRAEEKRLFYVAATRARDHLVLSGRLGEGDLPSEDSFDSAKDRLSWVKLGLELSPEDLARGAKTFQHGGVEFVVPLLTDLQAIDLEASTSRPAETSYGPVLAYFQEESERDSKALLSPDLPSLKTLARVQTPPSFAATQLSLYEESPAEYYQRYILGVPAAGLAGEENKKRRGQLLFGELAHAALEEILAYPTQDRSKCVARLLLDANLADEGLQSRFQTELLNLLAVFEQSAFRREILAAQEAYAEQAFTLKLKNGYIHGIIDRICRDPQGGWHLIDYKTGPLKPEQRESEGRRYLRQLQIYALCLQGRYPAQHSYPATIYFTELDDTYTFEFSPAELQGARVELEGIIAEITTRWPA